MTTIWYVRHAEPERGWRDDATRPLTEKGMRDRLLLVPLLKNAPLAAAYTSPYRRAVDTVAPVAADHGLSLCEVPALRERGVGDWLPDDSDYSRRQWADFDYRLPGGESLRGTQARALTALRGILSQNEGRHILLGGHGTVLCLLLQAFDPPFGYDDCAAMSGLCPWLVRFDFENERSVKIDKIDVFSQNILFV